MKGGNNMEKKLTEIYEIIDVIKCFDVTLGVIGMMSKNQNLINKLKTVRTELEKINNELTKELMSYINNGKE